MNIRNIVFCCAVSLAGCGDKARTDSEIKHESPRRITTAAEAIAIARAAVKGSVEIPPDSHERVEVQDGIYVVSFLTTAKPLTVTADYHARVKIDGETGRVTEILSGS